MVKIGSVVNLMNDADTNEKRSYDAIRASRYTQKRTGDVTDVILLGYSNQGRTQ